MRYNLVTRRRFQDALTYPGAYSNCIDNHNTVVVLTALRCILGKVKNQPVGLAYQ